MKSTNPYLGKKEAKHGVSLGQFGRAGHHFEPEGAWRESKSGKMKKITILLFALMVSSIHADNQVVEWKYKNKPIENDYLGIISLSLNATMNLKFLGDPDPDKQQIMVYKKIFQGLPQAFKNASSCSRTEMCSTAVLDSVSPCILLLDHNDTMSLNLPLRVHFSQDKDAPKHYLVIEITEVSDDSSSREVYVDWAGRHTPMMGSTARPGARPEPVRARGVRAGGNGVVDIMVADKEKPEECLHLACKYAFVDCSNNELVCWGIVSADGCSTSADRNGPNGVWNRCLKELVKEIVDDSPFKLK